MKRRAKPQPPTKHTYYIGLDLGQAQDYTALCIVRKVYKAERLASGETVERFDAYHLQHLERFPLMTPYSAIATRMRRIQEAPQLRGHHTTVVADTTGVGRPVFEMLQEAGVMDLYGVTITPGDTVTQDGLFHRVPKRDLVSTLPVLLQNGQLKFAGGLPLAEVLRAELQNFRVKISLSGHDTYEAWREADHDDLVLALAMACWFGEHVGKPPVFILY